MLALLWPCMARARSGIIYSPNCSPWKSFLYLSFTYCHRASWTLGFWILQGATGRARQEPRCNGFFQICPWDLYRWGALCMYIVFLERKLHTAGMTSFDVHQNHEKKLLAEAPLALARSSGGISNRMKLHTQLPPPAALKRP